MSIKLLTSLSGADGSFAAGQVVDHLTEKEEAAFIEKGMAEPVNASKAKVKTKAKQRTKQLDD